MALEKTVSSKLPSFTSFKKKEDRGGAIAGLSAPQDLLSDAAAIRTKGVVGRASLKARLSDLKPNEMAFILAGLSILILAPLIEFVFSRSSPDQTSMRSEFDNPSFLPDEGEVKEIGISRMAAGGLLGQNDRVVKRLDAPDPMKLIESGDLALDRVNPGVVESQAGRKKDKAEKSNWEDALSMAARGSVSSANRSAGLPRPSSKIVGKLAGALSGLQGLSALNAGGGGGGGGASVSKVSLAPPNSQGLTGTVQRSDALTRAQLPPEFSNGGKLGPDVSGGKAATFLNSAPNAFSRPPSGMTVETPSSPQQTQVGPTQSPGGGRPTEGEPVKAPVLNSAKDTRSNQSVKSLAQEMMEYNAKKRADLNFEIQKYNQIDKPKMILQQELQTAGQLANTALQGMFDLLKTALQKTQGAQGQQGSAGGAASGGSAASDAGDGSDSSSAGATSGVRRDPNTGAIDGETSAVSTVGTP